MVRGEAAKMSVCLLEDLVRRYQEGEPAVFDEIYSQLEKHRDMSFHRKRGGMFTEIAPSDIYALYDDCLLSAVETYKPTTAKFVTFLNTLFDRRAINLVKSETKQERVQSNQMQTMDVVTAEGVVIAETIEDTDSISQLLLIEGSDIVNKLKEFGEVSPRNKVNSILIACDTMFFETAEEKYDKARAITGLDASNSALRKRCQRAKADFRGFVEEYQNK